MKRLMLLSGSRRDSMGYLEHATEQLHTLLRREKRTVLFVPFAAVSFSFDEFAKLVGPVFEGLGYGFSSIHTAPDPVAAVEKADAIAVGGGNTFALLTRMYGARIIEPIRAKVADGTPYTGWSAGCNVALPTIRTTNDMPVIQPPSLAALGLVPFQINPHFISGKPAGYNGESREERLDEFLTINPNEEVLALPEGSALSVEGETCKIFGDRGAMLFRKPKTSPVMLAEGSEFPLSRIPGPSVSAEWPNFK